MLAMGMYPAVQRKAQAELDAVVGPNRLPDFSDLDSLVYARAVAMETMRWSPVNPFSVPHTSMAEDEYRGYRIPKGSTILVVSSSNFRCERCILTTVTECMVSPTRRSRNLCITI